MRPVRGSEGIVGHTRPRMGGVVQIGCGRGEVARLVTLVQPLRTWTRRLVRTDPCLEADWKEVGAVRAVHAVCGARSVHEPVAGEVV